MPLSPGTRLGPYEILAPIGAGGMGEVYKARDTRLNRDVAIKVLPDDFARDPGRLQRFKQEAQAVAALNHPNIVGVYDVGENFIVSELVDGQTLRAAENFLSAKPWNSPHRWPMVSPPLTPPESRIAI